MYGRTVGLSATLALLAVLAGCANSPYVRNPSQYNRESAEFRTGVVDRTAVTICYSKRDTNPAEIARMAAAECQRFGKTASFYKQSLQECPLMTPAAAIFDCLEPGQRAEDIQR